jgi:pimeloyl-ACP methyl ester carboxylesterase
MSSRDRFFDAAGVTLRYVEAGRGEPVVLLHSYTGDVERQFLATGFFEALARTYRVIGLDLRGHGQSGKPHDPRQYGAQMALDVERLLDHLGLSQGHVVGYSLGAHIAAQLVTLRPGRLITATLGGACGRRCWTAADDARVAVEAAEMDQALLRTQLLRLWPPERGVPSEAELCARSTRYLRGNDPQALAAIRRSNRGQVVDDDALAASGVPMLGVVGTEDPYRHAFAALQARVPGLQVVQIDGATHDSAAARPEFLHAVQRFLRGHRRSDA